MSNTIILCNLVVFFTSARNTYDYVNEAGLKHCLLFNFGKHKVKIKRLQLIFKLCNSTLSIDV